MRSNRTKKGFKKHDLAENTAVHNLINLHFLELQYMASAVIINLCSAINAHR